MFDVPVLSVGFRHQAATAFRLSFAPLGITRHAASKRPDNALKVRTFRPPATLQRARFMRWLTSTLLADDAGSPGLEAAHAAPVPAEEPEFTLKNRGRRFRRRLVAEVAYRRPCRRRASRGAVVPIGRDGRQLRRDVRRRERSRPPARRAGAFRETSSCRARRRRPVSGRTFRATSAASSAVVFPVSGQNSTFSGECRPRH